MNNSDIRFYLTLLRRRIPYVIAAMAIGGAIGIAIALSIAPTYRATAKVLVEGAEIPADLARTTATDPAADQLQLIQQQVTTRTNLLALAKQFNIYGSDTDLLPPDKIVDDIRSRIAFEQVSLSMNANAGGASIFSVSFDAADRQLAASVVNDLVAIIIDRNVSARYDRAGATMEFFKSESMHLNDALGKLETRIAELKQTHQESLPEGLEFQRSQQASLQEQMLSLGREDAALRARRLNVSMTGGPAQEGGSATSPERQSLIDLNRALTEQLAIYAEDSPTIVALRARIATLRNRANAEESKTRGDAGAPLSDQQIELAGIDARLKAISSQKATITEGLNDLAAAIAATPATEKELNELLRSRDNIQIQYNTAIAKLGEASTGNRIEMGAKGGSFSILESAIPPQKPIKPRRRLIAAGGVAGGFGVGAGLILLLELLNKTIRRPSDVAKVLQTLPLATIPMIEIPRARRVDARHKGFGLMTAASAVALVVMCVSVSG